MKPKLNHDHLQLVIRALGLDNSKESYRNRYIAGPNHLNISLIQDLEVYGYMKLVQKTRDGKYNVYAVTDLGEQWLNIARQTGQLTPNTPEQPIQSNPPVGGDLIKINQTAFGDEQVNTVNARELWEFLGSRQQYADWIKNRIKKYGFGEGVDYLIHKVMKQVSHQGGMRKQEFLEHHISVSMAKELAMVEDNEKGRQIRQYFIEVEKRSKHGGVQNLTRLQIAEMLVESEKEAIKEREKNALLSAKIQEDAPKVDFVNLFDHAKNGDILVRDLAKRIGRGCREKYLRAFLIEEELISSSWKPYAQYSTGHDQPYFRVYPTAHEEGKRTVVGETLRITPLGQRYIINLWNTRKGQGQLFDKPVRKKPPQKIKK